MVQAASLWVSFQLGLVQKVSEVLNSSSCKPRNHLRYQEIRNTTKDIHSLTMGFCFDLFEEFL